MQGLQDDQGEGMSARRKMLGWFVAIGAFTFVHLLLVMLAGLIGIWLHLDTGEARLTFWMMVLVVWASAIAIFLRWREQALKRQRARNHATRPLSQ